MPECHSCQHAARIGAAARAAFAGTPCATCTLSDAPSHAGKTFISMDAGQGYSDGLRSGTRLDGDLSHLGPLFDDPQEAEDALALAAAVLRELLRLKPTRQAIIVRRVTNPDESLTELAAELGLTPQAVCQTVTRIERALPALRGLFTHNRKYGTRCPQRAKTA